MLQSFEIVPAMANRQQNDVLRSLCRVARNLPETSPCLVEILDWKVVCYQMAITKLEDRLSTRHFFVALPGHITFHY